MNIWLSLFGTVRATLTSADISATLRFFNAAGIELQDVICPDILTAEFTMLRKDWKRARSIAQRRGDSVRLLHRTGTYWAFKALLHRPVFVIGMLLLLAVSIYLPTRVLFVHVEGNQAVPANKIIEKAAQCGIRFGTSRRAVRSEKVKNALLEAMPELQWAGVNTSGCVAVITVRERTTAEETKTIQCVSSLVASRDGVIQECTVTKGTAVCRPGQAVQEGQVLISGYTDSGLTLRACAAEGEVFALTERNLALYVPANYELRGERKSQTIKYSLLIGKKRINFYKGSGISDSSCVRMYVENYLSLPGGLYLPLALITETWTDYDTECSEITVEEPMIRELANDLLQHQLHGGRILSGDGVTEPCDGVILYRGKYQCYELISIRKNEEIIKPHE